MENRCIKVTTMQPQDFSKISRLPVQARAKLRFFVLLCAQLLEEVEGWIFSYAAASTLWRRRSNPARPYMDRLMTFNRLICPSSAPGQRQGSMYGIAVLTQDPGKALEAAGLSG